MPDYPFLFDDECFSRPASARPSVPLRREPARSENVLGVGAAVARIRSALGGMLGGACGAWYASIVGLGATGTGVTGIFGILLHLHMPLQYIIMMAISFGVSFAVTWVIWSPEEVKA